MTVTEILVIFMLGSFIALLVTGYPIAYILSGISILFSFVGYFSDLYLGTSTGLNFVTIGLIVNRIWGLVNNWVLVALPLFIFMGIMLDKSRIAEKLMQALEDVLGSLRGGLAISATVIGVILAASTGIIGASVVLLSLLSLPIMMKQGYNKELSVGTVCSAGTLGILIPPSIMLVIMADQLAISVGDLFMGAVFPGLILASLYVVFLITVGLVKPEFFPLRANKVPFSFKIVINLTQAILPPIMLILAVLGSIFFGVATPTEASGIGAFGAILLALYYRQLNIKVLKEVACDSLKTTGFIYGIFVTATAFALVLRQLGGDEFIEKILLSLPFGAYGLLFFVLVLIFLLGFFLDWIEITLIILPILSPVILQYDWDINGFGQIQQPEIIWFAILIAVTLQTSFLTPPVGFALFYLRGVAPKEITTKHIYRGIIPFIILQLIGLSLLIIFPEIVTWLPAKVYAP